ncbi:uncharacterized protein LOC133794250 [Humulus lupulus]|uniref:uncharacterized protein LOC133794250 n=1 Tax=Humulus lupulus TaxID=3486 RepID=UPI002B4139E3|nr:uncharacterized protein LOC133794250 [Humulus lupulus]
MLEKIGLPGKPSVRGNNWVVDASHCQGCSSQFTFINRKHHCRRCGGLFCNSCTQQRMVLRGQGDSPVRICEPCKTLEEAARFELRHGHRSRAWRGSLKSTSKSENEVLNQIPSNEKKEAFASGLGSSSKQLVSSTQGAASSNTEVVNLDGEGEVCRSQSIDEFGSSSTEKGATSPDDLRQQALDEKKMYKQLKGEGKSDEALKAFKRGKELERQADALEKTLRKSRRKVLLAGNAEEIQINDVPGESRKRNKVGDSEGKEKDDLAAELRELGWSDMDLHSEDKKGTNLTLEGELSSLLGEVSVKPGKNKGANFIDKTQVVAHKKKALALKREGKLAEAKEELKRAKVLEKELEEQELLAEAEDSDDDLSALIRSMDSDKQDLYSDPNEQQHGYDFSSLLGAADDQIIDSSFDVTDDDMEDPEMAAALKSLGWTEDSVNSDISFDKEALLTEILSLKREAVNKKRAGNVSEAMNLLKKAKLLERDLEGVEPQKGKVAQDPARVQKDSNDLNAHRSFTGSENTDSKFAPKSKLMIQKELLGLKKRALALRREGRLDEAEEELKKGKILEHQLEEMEKASNVKTKSVAVHTKGPNSVNGNHDFPFNLPIGDEMEENISDQDMHDPTYLSLLRNLGWKDEDNDLAEFSPESKERNASGSSVPQAAAGHIKVPKRSKAEMQRELLGLKRKALALRRQGESEEAEEVLRMAKALEAQIAETESLGKDFQHSSHTEIIIKSPLGSADEEGDAVAITETDMHDPEMLSVLKNLGWNDDEQDAATTHEKHEDVAIKSKHSDDTSLIQSSPPLAAPARRSKGELQRELLNLKRKALALRRKGETEEAEELLRSAKVLETQIEELEAPKQVHLHEASKDEKPQSFGLLMNQDKSGISDVETSRVMSQETSGRVDLSIDKSSMGSDTANHPSQNSEMPIPLNSQLIVEDQMILGDMGTQMAPEKQDGLNYSSDGSIVATAIRLQTVASSMRDMTRGDDMKYEKRGVIEKPRPYESNIIEEHVPAARESSVRSEKQESTVVKDEKPHFSEASSVKEHVSQINEATLKQDILARKRKALALKREGKLAEAREELRQAKLLEKHLETENTKSKTNPTLEPVSTPSVSSVGQKERGTSNNIPKPISSRERFKLQQESLAHKRQALKLRREGRIEEADAEFELAKALETQLEELSANESVNSSVDGLGTEKDMGVEDFLDPQLLSALKAIGIENTNTNTVPRVPDKLQSSKLNVGKSDNPNQERIQLEEQVKAEKVKALNLKRSGRQVEALDALRKAKLLEKKLNSLA